MTETSWRSRIHPELREALDLLPACVVELGDRTTDPPALRKELAVVTEAAAAGGYPPPPPPTVTVENLEVSAGPGAEPVGLRIYRPTERPAHAVPAVIHFHGGGFMIGQPEDDDLIVIPYVETHGVAVISVRYRLAPEHPYPAALTDAWSALSWVASSAPDLGIDLERIAVSGASAGGCLATALALRARDSGGPRIALALLDYPVLDDRSDSASTREFADTPIWNAPASIRMWAAYLPAPPGTPDYWAVPARCADLTGFPPTVLITADLDPLHGEGLAFAERLEADRVPLELHEMAGAIHGFDRFASWTAPAQQAARHKLRAVARLLPIQPS